MASTAPALGAFPSPFSIETPPGCEGWEEMYPYYALFDERRRDTDENRFWFWNSMHFPVPMPAFDAICIDSPYQAVGAWQNRVFAVPPAMGIDYRIVNGYVYISGNPVTDPAKIAERAEFFQKRAGYYYSNWSELYGKWRAKMEALIAELGELRVPDLPEYEPDEVAFSDDRNTAFYELLDSYGRALRLGDQMWQNHFEFLLLGYGAYATFADFCKGQLPDIPDQHIAQMVAGIDVLLFKPDAELRRLARLAIETGVDGAFVEGRTPGEIDAAAERQRGGTGLAFRARGGQGSMVQHGHRRRPVSLLPELARRSEHSLRVADRPHRRAARGRTDRASDRGDPARARPPRRGVRRTADRGSPRTVQRAARPLADGVPVRRGAQVLLRLLVPDPVVEQDSRVRGAARRTQVPRGRRGHLPAHTPRGRNRDRRARAELGDGRGGTRARTTGRRSSRGARSCSTSSRTGRRRPRSA